MLAPRAILNRSSSVPWTTAVIPQARALHHRISIVPFPPKRRAPTRPNLGRPFSVTAARGVMIPNVFVPPLVFVGLLVALWTWKCTMIILFQNRLLYMSYMPPFARSEKIADYEQECRPVQWKETYIRSLDGTRLAVCIGNMPVTTPEASPDQRKRSVVICYFQGNGGSTPPRLPLLSSVLRELACSSSTSVTYTLVALSYRGYWKSSGRASQPGIERDAQALLDWVSQTFAVPDRDLQVILWGHSLGSAVVSTATATYLARLPSSSSSSSSPVAGLVLETPSTSTKDVLKNLYPQRWLPYRYLWPFLWNRWSSAAAFERIARWRDNGPQGQRGTPPILLLVADEDELIPSQAAHELERLCQTLGLDAERKNVAGALHSEAVLKPPGKAALVRFIRKATDS
ncbi:Alpha/Beta hydrolase protein [Aspergillus terricola var. indicus]